MNTIKNILLWIAGVTLGVLLLAWRSSVSPSLTAHIVLLDDRSRSMPDTCDALAALGQRALALPDVRSRSTFALFATTDADPSFVASFKLPTGRLSTESHHRQAAREKVFLADLDQHCRKLPRTHTSPIFRSIKQTVAHLRAQNTNGRGALHLFVRTDLRETSDHTIKKALDGAAQLPVTPALINNGDINVAICGYAQTSGPSATRNTERLIEVWRALFSHPDLVRFEPYCARPAVQPEDGAVRRQEPENTREGPLLWLR